MCNILETTVSGCYKHINWGLTFWTAGQRIDPSRCSTFIWRVTSTNAYSETLSTMTYTNWYSGQPNCHSQQEKCMNLGGGRSYGWNDLSCSIEGCSVCELDMWVHGTNRLLDYHSKTQINRHRLTYSLLNQTVQQKLISRWDRRTLRGNSKYCLNHSMLWNVTTPIYSFSLKRSLSRRGIATFLVHRDFLIIAGYLVTYFLTDEFLVDKEWSVIFNEETVCGQEMV